jgi:hypothetical protein
MPKTDRGRYDDAVAYLAKFNVGLSQRVKEVTRGRERNVGGKLSLGGKSWDADEEKREATRALLLCIIAFFGSPHNAGDTSGLDFYVTTMRDDCRTKTRAQISEELRCYLILSDATLEGLARAAETVKKLDTIKYFPMRLRTDVNVGRSPICYDGVFNWLFAAGFISRQWLGKHGGDIHAETIHKFLGDGQKLAVSEWGKIPRGYIWNISKTTDRATCHWGVSLGDGLAAACNNTGQGQVKYLEGNDSYGQFVFTELCAILETTEKYAGKNRVVELRGDAGAETKEKQRVVVAQPAGTYIEVRSYSPLSGATEGIYR